MRHFYLCALLLLALAIRSQAQDFRPFRPGLTYQYSEAGTPGDTTHTLRLGPGTRVGADSVFQFGPWALPARAGNTTACFGTHLLRTDNLFGATLTLRAGGTMLLTAGNGQALRLQPRAAVGQSWPAMPGLTATLSSRMPGLVLGQTDSIATISFSNGQQLRLSKRFGLVEGPALIAWLNGRYRARSLQLTALPELGLGSSRLGALSIYDFQPGDVFLRHHTTSGFGGQLCDETWQRDSVLTRTPSQGGRVITYTIWSRRLYRGYGSPTAPLGFCSSTGTVLSPATTVTLTVSEQMQDPAAALTGSFYTYPNSPGYYGLVASVGVRAQRFPGRYEQQFSNRQACLPQIGDSLRLAIIIDAVSTQSFATGLGEVRYGAGGIYYDSSNELVGYIKGGQAWGQLRGFAQLLSTAPAKAAATTSVSPNPFTQELTVSFELSRPQAVAVVLHDALGRQVLSQPAAAMPAGAGKLALATAALAPGLYTLWLKPASGPAQVVKAVKVF
ncbi:hypothetical protein GCM10023185_03370 [Hymenobacter saemangeumensis]|uniref:T9SS type A sorting domain-containing protein n=1 Tax=Hymenobacter saemangeumensis TaxID=1084522 RepID=A0ABP8HZG4_9BACT